MKSKALIKRLELSRSALLAQMVNARGLFYRGESGIFLTSTHTPSFPMGIACFVQIIILKLSSDVITHRIRGSKRRWSEKSLRHKAFWVGFEESCHLWSICLAQGSLLLCKFLKILVPSGCRASEMWDVVGICTRKNPLNHINTGKAGARGKAFGSHWDCTVHLALDLVQKYGFKSKPEFIAGVKFFITKVKCLLTEIPSIKSCSDKHSLIQILTFSTLLSVKNLKNSQCFSGRNQHMRK